MALSDVVNVSITAQTTSVGQASFDMPLICAYFATSIFPERVREYNVASDLTGLTSDGFATTDPVYLIAAALRAQNPCISAIKVGRRALPPTMDVDITPAAPAVAAVTIYTVTINGTDFEFTSDATPTAAEVTAGLVALINAGSEPVTATDNTTYITLAADVAGTMFTLELTDDSDGENLWTREEQTTDPGIATDLANIAIADNDWYVLLMDSQGAAEIEAAATWTETASKLFIATTGDSEVPTVGAGDIATTLSGANRARTVLVYDEHPHDRCAEAWAGVMLPKDPGSATWKFKTLSGPTARTYTTTQVGYLEAKECNYYSTVGGVDIMQQGVTTAGEFADITRGVDWFKARLQERIYADMVNLDKVEFTNDGIGMIVSEIWAQIAEGQAKKFIAKDPAATVTAPDASDVSSANKIARNLPDISFTAPLSGAIHATEISGIVYP